QLSVRFANAPLLGVRDTVTDEDSALSGPGGWLRLSGKPMPRWTWI
ncbi:hypothetical protein A2U01_0119577, partial [Trifolium medium]|nr:hypothetical protein [Trifolium medium]